MKRQARRKINNQSGAAMLISVVFFLFTSLAIISGLVTPTVREFRTANVNLNSKQSYFLAESGSEDAFYRIRKNMTIGTSETITLGSNTETTTITSISSSLKHIVSLGSVSSYERKSDLMLSTGAGVAFSYGVQIGDGGLEMESNSRVNGNAYSNGRILGANGAVITNSAVVADATGKISFVTVNGNATGHFLEDITVGGNSNSVSLLRATVGGNAVSDSVSTCTIHGSAIYDTKTSCTITGAQTTPNSTTFVDPVNIPLPITASQITGFENDAVAGGTVGSQSISGNVSLGPKKIDGNLTVENNATLIITGTVWVTGTISVNNNATVKLSPNYGGASGILMAGVAGDSVKGQINLFNNVNLLGSGTAGSYLLVLSQRNNATSTAIDLSNNVAGAIFYAGTGVINLSNNAAAKEITAYKLHLNSNTTVNYESGLANTNFSSGPSVSWNVLTWKEAP